MANSSLRVAFWKRRDSWFSWAVWLFSGFSRYTHVELLCRPVGTERWLWCSSETGTGARVTDDISGNPDKWDIYEMPWGTPEMAAEAVRLALAVESHKGGYDWWGVFCSQLVPAGFHEGKAWFCSELVAYLLKQAGIVASPTSTVATGIRLDRQPNEYSPASLFKALRPHLTQVPVDLLLLQRQRAGTAPEGE